MIVSGYSVAGIQALVVVETILESDEGMGPCAKDGLLSLILVLNLKDPLVDI